MSDDKLGEINSATPIGAPAGITVGSTKRRGMLYTATSQVVGGSGYPATPDRVSGITCAADSLLFVLYRALVKTSNGNGNVAVNAYTSGSFRNGVGRLSTNGGVLGAVSDLSSSAFFGTLRTDDDASTFGGFIHSGSSSSNSDLGTVSPPAGDTLTWSGSGGMWKPVILEVPTAGVYDIDILYGSSTSTTITVKERKLYVWTVAFP